MFENGKQNELRAAAPDSGAGLPAGGLPGRQWSTSPAWLRHLRLVASLHARIPDSALLPVADGEAAREDSSSHTANEKEGRRFDCKLSILDTRAGRGLPPFFPFTPSD